jgi:hypothetical protein
MRVQFTHDKEEMVDSAMRFLRRSKTFKSVRWQGLITSIFFCLLVVYVACIALMKNPYLGVIAAVVSTLAILALFPFLHENGTKKRLRKLFKEHYGNKNSFTCDVELTPEEIRITGEHSQTVYDWTMVDEIVVTSESVDLFARMGGVVVRNRAFESTDKREEFIAFARKYLAASRGASDEIRSNNT